MVYIDRKTRATPTRPTPLAPHLRQTPDAELARVCYAAVTAKNGVLRRVILLGRRLCLTGRKRGSEEGYKSTLASFVRHDTMTAHHPTPPYPTPTRQQEHGSGDESSGSARASEDDENAPTGAGGDSGGSDGGEAREDGTGGKTGTTAG